LQYLIDFLEHKNIEKTEIFSQLKCSNEEALILRHLVERHVKGDAESMVYQVLTELFPHENYEYIRHLPLVKNLLDLGWITQSAFAQTKIGDTSHLELINSSVALSISFVKLLEEGTLEMPLPEPTPYNDNLEYLKDQFQRIELYQKISTIRHHAAKNSLNIDRLMKRLDKLETRIKERIEKSKQSLPVEMLFQEYELNKKEQIIFLALLKEEYSGELESLREMNTLINLISENDYDKIKYRSLIEDSSTLIDKEIIDYDELLTSFGGVTRSFFINEEFLRDIMHPHKAKKPQKIKLEALVEEQEIFELMKPKTKLEDVVLHPKTRELLDTILKQMDKNVAKLLSQWGVTDKKKGIDAKLIFYGPPGTGKTMTALSFSKTLKRSVLSFDCSKILSMYVGESEKNVRKIFDSYKELAKKTKTEPVLLLNEADQFLSARTTSGGSGSDKMHNQMQNIFLEQIENFEGILIATTNLLETIDVAFSRRFDYKIEFAKPNFKQRLELWQNMLPQNADYEENFSIEALAHAELTGGQIKVIIKNTALAVAVKELPIFTNEDFNAAILREKKGAFGEDKTVGFVS
jgi:AAA+ superfamily predicted ATPase